MATHISTRRGILGEVLVASTAPAFFATKVTQRSSAIDRAIASYECARRLLNATPPSISSAEDERRCEAAAAAMNRLLSLAPSTADQLARKMAALWDYDRLPTETCFSIIMRDVHTVT